MDATSRTVGETEESDISTNYIKCYFWNPKHSLYFLCFCLFHLMELQQSCFPMICCHFRCGHIIHLQFWVGFTLYLHLPSEDLVILGGKCNSLFLLQPVKSVSIIHLSAVDMCYFCLGFSLFDTILSFLTCACLSAKEWSLTKRTLIPQFDKGFFLTLRPWPPFSWSIYFRKLVIPTPGTFEM